MSGRHSDPRKRARAGRGASPVIGIILMVAITVILAAIIGAFAMGLSDELVEAQPTNYLTVDGELTYDDEGEWKAWDTLEVLVSHDTGDSFEADDVRIVVREDGSIVGVFENENLEPASGEISVGESLSLDDGLAGELDEPSNTEDPERADWHVDVIHQPSESIIGQGEMDVEPSS